MNQDSLFVTMISHNWIVGTIEDMSFEAKVYDVPSLFGIDYGRVVKLTVYAKRLDQEIIVYERGWEKYPTKNHEDILDAILKYCQNLPPADKWQLENGTIISKEGLQ